MNQINRRESVVVSDSEMKFKAGVATVCITPDEPLWLAGFAVRTQPASGKISDLYATALALEDQTGHKFVIASIDVIAVTRSISDAVANAIESRHGLKRHQILLSATHTHYGPEFRADKRLFFNIPEEFAAKIPRVSKTIVEALIQVIENALNQLEPVRIFVRKTHVEFAHNRRRHGITGGTAPQDDVVDHDVPIFDCINAAGVRKAIVFGYACHNTTIPPDDLRYCGDWSGFASEELRRCNPAATAIFIPGAGADQTPEPSGSVELSQLHGRDIATAIQHALESPGREITDPIRAELVDVPLALQPVCMDSMNQKLASEDPAQRVKAQYLLDCMRRGETLIGSYAAPVHVVAFGGEVLLIALSGEPVIDWSQKFKREFGAQSTHDAPHLNGHNRDRATEHGDRPEVWVAGYCNDMFGYLPTKRVQTEGGYEGGRANLWSWIPAPFTNDVEDRVSAAVRQLVERTTSH